MDDGSIVELYLARDETAIAQTSEKYGAALRTLANRILDDEPASEECENVPGESQGWGSLVGCHLWGRTESDTTEAT